MPMLPVISKATLFFRPSCRTLCRLTVPPVPRLHPEHQLVESTRSAREDVCQISLLEAFVSAKEEELLMKEVSKSMRRKRYQYDHWDGAITGYRETEKVQWISENEPVINRLALTASRAAVGGCTLELLPTIHVLDLAKDGYIKPHVDSVKFCGRVIAGISLLSPSLMNFVHKDNSDRRITILLPSCSLYIIRDEVRYQYTHEILPDIHTPFKGQSVARGRRVSIIARSAPMDTHL